MTLFDSSTNNIIAQINPHTKLGELRNMAKAIKKNHPLAMKLWKAGSFRHRLLAILLMDCKLLSISEINLLSNDMRLHPFDEQNQLMDWLMTNQLLKNKQTIALVESWDKSEHPLQRRAFWYHQGRLRWLGQTSPANTKELLAVIESDIASEDPAVQWAMNFTAGWIGIFDKQYRNRCIAIGEKTGLYKGEKFSKGCTPNYLPLFIAIETARRNL